MLWVKKVGNENETRGGESVEGLSGVIMFRSGKKTDSMDLHRHADPSPPNAITLRARKTSLYGYGAG